MIGLEKLGVTQADSAVACKAVCRERLAASVQLEGVMRVVTVGSRKGRGERVQRHQLRK